MVDGFGVGRLQGVLGSAAGQAAEMDEMYAGMLRKLEKLAREVEKSNLRVLEQVWFSNPVIPVCTVDVHPRLILLAQLCFSVIDWLNNCLNCLVLELCIVECREWGFVVVPSCIVDFVGNLDNACIAGFDCNYNPGFRLPKVSCNARSGHLTEGSYGLWVPLSIHHVVPEFSHALLVLNQLYALVQNYPVTG
jgi:hypothetical protein